MDQAGKRACQFGRFFDLTDQRFDVDDRLLRRGRLHLAKIGIGVERRFKLLRVDLAIFIEDVRVDPCNHVDLGMSRIALRSLQIAVIELELVGGAGVSERVENHVWKPRFLLELAKLLVDDAPLAGTTVLKRHDKVKVLILIAKELLQLGLRLMPFSQDVGYRLGKPYFANTGIGLGLFEDEPCAGVAHERLKDVIHVFLAKHFNGTL